MWTLSTSPLPSSSSLSRCSGRWWRPPGPSPTWSPSSSLLLTSVSMVDREQHYQLCIIILWASILLTMCLALERWITVCFPFFKLRHRWGWGLWGSSSPSLTPSWPARYYILPVCLISILCNVTRFLELEVIEVNIDLSKLRECL